MSENFNIDTTQAQSYAAGGLNPNDPSQNFGDMIAANQMKQQEQVQLVQQAVERTKQAKLTTKQKTSADDEGVNPELADYISKDEALQYIAHEWKVDEKDPEIQKLASTLPDQVERRMIQTLIRKKDRFPSRPVGQPFKATEGNQYPTVVDGTGNAPLKAGQWFQAMADDEGNLSYVPSGETAGMIRSDGRGENLDHKDWQKLVYDMDVTGASSRKALGVNYSSYVAAIRGENLLHQPTVTSQNMKEVTRDLTRILQQGVPTDAGSEGMEYHSLVGDIARKLQYWEGKPKNAIPPEDKLYLEDSFHRLKAISLDVIETKIRHMEAGFPDLIQSHRPEWDKVTDNLRHPPTSNMDAYVATPPPANSPGMLHQVYDSITGHKSAPAEAPAAPVNNQKDPLGIL
jgi:hypothetical protein